MNIIEQIEELIEEDEKAIVEYIRDNSYHLRWRMEFRKGAFKKALSIIKQGRDEIDKHLRTCNIIYDKDGVWFVEFGEVNALLNNLVGKGDKK